MSLCIKSGWVILKRCSIWKLLTPERRRLQIQGWVSPHRHIIKAGIFFAKSLANPESESNLKSKRYTLILQVDTTFPVALFILPMWSQTQLTLWLDLDFSMTWKWREFWIQQPENLSSPTTHTGSSTTSSKLDCIQWMAWIDCFYTWRLVSTDKLQVSKPRENNNKYFHIQRWWFCETKKTQKAYSKMNSTPSGSWTSGEYMYRSLCTVFQLPETWPLVKGLQKQNLQRAQLWTTTQQAFAQRLLNEGGYMRCLRCYDSGSNKHHTRRTPCSSYKTREQPERAGNVWYGILNLICGQVICIYTAAARLKSVFVSSRNPTTTKCQAWNSANSGFSKRETSTIDDSAILCSRETEVGWPDCRSARVERSLPTSEELVNSELQSKRISNNSWTRLLRHPSPIRIQKIRQ